MNDDKREKAGKTAVDGFIVVERLYRHAYQTLMALKDELKTEDNLKAESPMYTNPKSDADPKSWLYYFRGIYLAEKKISLEEYRKKEVTILFLQASLYNVNRGEPLLRFGVIEKIFNMSTWKGIRFDDYVRMILAELHTEPKPGAIKASHCEGVVKFDEKPLLDIRDDNYVTDLAGEIGEKYARLLFR